MAGIKVSKCGLPLGRGVTVGTYTVSALILNIEFRPIFATLLE